MGMANLVLLHDSTFFSTVTLGWLFSSVHVVEFDFDDNVFLNKQCVDVIKLYYDNKHSYRCVKHLFSTKYG